jgi:hypothetical protein
VNNSGGHKPTCLAVHLSEPRMCVEHSDRRISCRTVEGYFFGLDTRISMRGKCTMRPLNVYDSRGKSSAFMKPYCRVRCFEVIFITDVVACYRQPPLQRTKAVGQLANDTSKKGQMQVSYGCARSALSYNAMTGENKQKKDRYLCFY